MVSSEIVADSSSSEIVADSSSSEIVADSSSSEIVADSSSEIVADSSSEIVADSSHSQAWTSASVDAHLSQQAYQVELGICILFVLAAILGAIVMKGVLP